MMQGTNYIHLKRLTLALLFTIGVSLVDSCGYDSCPSVEDGMINVHLVPHSHDDVGWLKTVDQYYLGANRGGWYGWEEVQRAGVQYTLDTVLTELAMHPDRRYIQVETAYFQRWWKQQDQITKDLAKELVDNGQLEFIGGGWSMNDEGAAHYAAIIDQMTLGLRILNDTFGECARPRVAWQIDPFGHSKEQANLFAGMGFDGLFFARLDWRDKTKREYLQEMEMVWKASEDLGAESDLFTGVLFSHYGPPAGFCWDLLCNDAPIMDSEYLENNLDGRISTFVNFIDKQAKYYRTKHLILTMGMDFHYQAAHSWFMNLDKLIKHVNGLSINGSQINIFYSTPSCYLKALHDADEVWPIKDDDFFPYASDPHAYWSGYFTSRPTSKRMMREAEAHLNFLNQLMVQHPGLADGNNTDPLSELKEAVGIVQHHDAITGTEKQHVANDYHHRLHQAVQLSFGALGIDSLYGNATSESQTFCPLLNISQCAVSEQFVSELQVEIFNPLSRSRTYYPRFPVKEDNYVVTDEDGAQLPSQLVPIPAHILDLPERNSQATHILTCLLKDIPAFGSRVIKIGRQQPKQTRHTSQPSQLQIKHDESRQKFYIVDSKRGHTAGVKYQAMYYRGHRGNNTEFEFRASGAYIFRPEDDSPTEFRMKNTFPFDGDVVNELHVTFYEDWVTLVIRLYKEAEFVELDWTVGPIPVDDGVGKEVIMRYSGDIANNGEFFTDSNGRQMMRRIRNYRPTFEINMTEPTAQNYYPVNAKIMMRDQENVLSVLNDRSQGGASIVDGSLELMVHRRLLDDDAFGVGEPLNETEYGQGLVARGRHWLIAGPADEESVEKHRVLAMDMFYEPVMIFNSKMAKPEVQLAALPPNIHVLSLERIAGTIGSAQNLLLLRLEHIFQTNEHSSLSANVTVDLTQFFTGIDILWAKETLLGGNAWKDDIQRLHFARETNDIHLEQLPDNQHRVEDDELVVDLTPMQIRTFIISFEFSIR